MSEANAPERALSAEPTFRDLGNPSPVEDTTQTFAEELQQTKGPAFTDLADSTPEPTHAPTPGPPTQAEMLEVLEREGPAGLQVLIERQRQLARQADAQRPREVPQGPGPLDPQSSGLPSPGYEFSPGGLM